MLLMLLFLSCATNDTFETRETASDPTTPQAETIPCDGASVSVPWVGGYPLVMGCAESWCAPATWQRHLEDDTLLISCSGYGTLELRWIP